MIIPNDYSLMFFRGGRHQVGGAMYAFAHAVSTTMLGGIFLAVAVMASMTVSALFYRSALGGKKELKMFNLGSTPKTPELAAKIKESAWRF